jgi:hypothetical protein
LSHFTTIETKITDADALKKALADLGYPVVEEGYNLPLYGYQRDRRPQTADIVVRRKYISPWSNDLGFKKKGSTYEMIISDYDVGLLGQDFIDRLTQRYAYHKILSEAKRQNWAKVKEEKMQDGTIKLLLTKY